MSWPQEGEYTYGMTATVEDNSSQLFQELEMAGTNFFQHGDQHAILQPVMSQEQTFEELQRLLGLAPAPQRRERNTSTCSQPTGSPESGISGCDSGDQALSPPRRNPMSPEVQADPVQMSMEQANIVPMDQQSYFEPLGENGFNGLLQLQSEANQLMNAELENLSGQLGVTTGQWSPLIGGSNPVLGQARPSMQPYQGQQTSPPFPIYPTSSPPSTATSVIVRAAPSHPAPVFSLPGSISFSDLTTSKLMDVKDTEKSSLPIVVTEFDNISEADQEMVEPKREPGPDGVYLCYTCGAKAGKHSYYGGQVCAACRAFFRRSVQSKYYEIFQCKRDKNCEINTKTKKNCQFCRFKKCLESGMKTSWVLSDDERNRRFNKFNKINMKTVNNDKSQIIKKAPPARLPELYMAFTLEEQQVLENIQNKFRGQYCNDTWLKKLLLLNRDAGINLIESAYKVKPIKYETWTWLVQSWSLEFSQNILPHFTKGHNIASRDFSQLINGSNLYVAHTFKSSMCISLPTIKKEDHAVSRGGGTESGDGAPCPMSRQVKELASNKYDVENLDLSTMLDNLNLSPESVPSMPSYSDLYPSHWADDPAMEEKHLQLITKIKTWPMNDKKEIDCNLVMMLMLVLFFDTNSNPLAKSESVGEIQLKYSLLLQRYLKSRMAIETANKKFLEAMLLLSEARELWEMNQQHAKA